MRVYLVQKVTPVGEVIEEAQIAAVGPAAAAGTMVSGKLIRGQKGVGAVLKAKVYSTAAGTTTLVRFYEREEA